MFRRHQPAVRARRASIGLIVLLVLALTGSASVPLSVAANSGLVGGGNAALLDLAMKFAPSPGLIRAFEGGEAIGYGKDGRLTMMLLGSDFRSARPSKGERTDMIMVLTINRSTGKMAAASLPRDLAYLPMPPSLGGGTYSGRINSLLGKYKAQYGRNGALLKMRDVVAHLLGVEIDYVAILRFEGFERMMGELGSIRVTTRAARDPKLWDSDPTGVLFPAASNWELYAGGQKCKGHFRFTTNDKLAGYYCHRALPYARTRKGPGNSDFKRQARGVDIVMAGIRKAVAGNYSSSKISSMTSRASAQGVEFYSSLPMTVANASEMYNLLKKAKTTTANRVVFAPKKYATKVSGSATYRVNVTAIRNWINAYFKNI